MKLQAIKPFAVTQSQQKNQSPLQQRQYKSKQIAFGSNLSDFGLGLGIAASIIVGAHTIAYLRVYKSEKIMETLETLKRVKIKCKK